MHLHHFGFLLGESLDQSAIGLHFYLSRERFQ